ncbi:hypothetical protein F4811DRAFT_526824 [Daldinia bambusicola]|nr:hypothetical protein F4811DRAFT_526824 [Daldinia bambusicola]
MQMQYDALFLCVLFPLVDQCSITNPKTSMQTRVTIYSLFCPPTISLPDVFTRTTNPYHPFFFLLVEIEHGGGKRKETNKCCMPNYATQEKNEYATCPSRKSRLIMYCTATARK